MINQKPDSKYKWLRADEFSEDKYRFRCDSKHREASPLTILDINSLCNSRGKSYSSEFGIIK